MGKVIFGMTMSVDGFIQFGPLEPAIMIKPY
jgi:hypothetical protein